MEPRDSFQCCEPLEHDLARVLLDQVTAPGRNARRPTRNGEVRETDRLMAYDRMQRSQDDR